MCVHACMDVCKHVNDHVCMCVCVCGCMRACVYATIHVCMNLSSAQNLQLWPGSTLCLSVWTYGEETTKVQKQKIWNRRKTTTKRRRFAISGTKGGKGRMRYRADKAHVCSQRTSAVKEGHGLSLLSTAW